MAVGTIQYYMFFAGYYDQKKRVSLGEGLEKQKTLTMDERKNVREIDVTTREKREFKVTRKRKTSVRGKGRPGRLLMALNGYT